MCAKVEGEREEGGFLMVYLARKDGAIVEDGEGGRRAVHKNEDESQAWWILN